MRYSVLMATLYLARAVLNGARSMGIRRVHPVRQFRAKQARWMKEIPPFSSFSLSASKKCSSWLRLRRTPLFHFCDSFLDWPCRSWTIAVV